MPWVNVFANDSCSVSLSDVSYMDAVPISNINNVQILEELEGVVYQYTPCSDVSGSEPPGGLVEKVISGFTGNEWSVVVPANGIINKRYRVRAIAGNGLNAGGDPAYSLVLAPVYRGDSDYLYYVEATEYTQDYNTLDAAGWYEFDPVTNDRDWAGLGVLMLGADSSYSSFFQYRAEWQVWVDEASPCEEIGRVSQAYASAHNRTRVQLVRVRSGEKRCIIANFNGAIPAGRKIVKADWYLEDAYSAVLSGGAITGEGRKTEVIVSTMNCGTTGVECAATFDNGEVYIQSFVIEVWESPYIAPHSAGQQQITITAP